MQPKWLHIRLDCSTRMRKFWCWNPEGGRPQSLKEVMKLHCKTLSNRSKCHGYSDMNFKKRYPLSPLSDNGDLKSSEISSTGMKTTKYTQCERAILHKMLIH